MTANDYSALENVSGATVCAFHETCFRHPDWPRQMPELDPSSLWYWIAVNHRHNALLWDEEDLARRTRVSDAEIAANKRAIDRYNQARNDATERVDELLLLALGLVDPATVATDRPVARVHPGARLNSETAGSMIDRLSILALKVRAMRAQSERQDVPEEHRIAARARLERLNEQRADLAACLDELLADCRAGRAWFKVYRQFKMYNDPRYNPVLVAEAAATPASR
ncbi:MAG: DUF4254 domain-containing protein [Casimicrobiaceae bacterium]|nr:DUF4254 domain-containing protein [Casimicrobiaceae bacterium]MDW8311380.1 DUF4254 domain-containing protein [Burkholderiales bacterium]